jgi:hypothetical protein
MIPHDFIIILVLVSPASCAFLFFKKMKKVIEVRAYPVMAKDLLVELLYRTVSSCKPVLTERTLGLGVYAACNGYVGKVRGTRVTTFLAGTVLWYKVNTSPMTIA